MLKTILSPSSLRIRAFGRSDLFRMSIFGFRAWRLVAARFVRIFRAHSQRDPTARGKLRGHDCFARRASFHEVIENAVGHCFVKRALAPIRSQIKLKRFAFDAEMVGHVVDVDPGEIGLARDGTKAGEIVGLEMNVIIAPRWIWKCFQPRFSWRGGQLRFASAEQRQPGRCRSFGFRHEAINAS